MKKLRVLALLATLTLSITSLAGCAGNLTPEEILKNALRENTTADKSEDDQERIRGKEYDVAFVPGFKDSSETTESIEIEENTEEFTEPVETNPGEVTGFGENSSSESTKSYEEWKHINSENSHEDIVVEDNIKNDAIIADKIYEQSQGNVVFSPLSLNYALGLVQAGAEGDAKKSLDKYLNTKNYASYANYSITNFDYIKETPDAYKCQIDIANSIWVDKDKTVNADYKDTVENGFKATISNLDFGNGKKSAKTVNDWVNEKTHKLIPKIVDENTFTPNTKVILANSLYFNAMWYDPWASVGEKEFTKVDGTKVNTEYMFMGTHTYYENDKAQAFASEYYGGTLFIGILPKKVDSNGDFKLEDLDLKGLLDSQTFDYKVRMTMPKLNCDCSANNLKEVLTDLGLAPIFDSEKSEITGIIDGENLKVDNIIQKCKIDVEEEHTEAAAATVVAIADNALAAEEREEKVLEFNRPYAFMLYNPSYKSVFFIGKVADPTK